MCCLVAAGIAVVLAAGLMWVRNLANAAGKRASHLGKFGKIRNPDCPYSIVSGAVQASRKLELPTPKERKGFGYLRTKPPALEPTGPTRI